MTVEAFLIAVQRIYGYGRKQQGHKTKKISEPLSGRFSIVLTLIVSSPNGNLIAR